MKLNAIHHIAIIISDIQAAKDFYVHKLGFKIIRENYRSQRNDWKMDLKHLAFCVEDVESAVVELATLGIEYEPIRYDDYTHKKMTFFFDPDGLPLELHE